MEQYDFFYKLAMIIDGDTEEVSQFKMPTESINNKNFWFNEQSPLFTLANGILFISDESTK
jgi:hypothetical protein